MAIRNSVTPQEYDQTLRDAVNNYYEHAMQDPSMSKEEALESTAQMAENYLNAVDEFQSNMESEAVANEVANDNTGNEAGIEDGNESLDGGDNGIGDD